MHRRARHFNAKDVGASGVYDTRFISGLSNNDTVSTWSSRTGTNNATQSVLANRPIYITNRLNGNPVVQFDGSNDYLTFSRFDASQAWTIAVVYRNVGTATYQGVILVRQSSTNYDRLSLLINNTTDYGPVGVGSNAPAGWGKGGSVREGQWRIVFGEWIGGGYDGSTYYRAYDDGAQLTLANMNVGGINANLTSSIGCSTSDVAYTNFWNGFMGSVSFGFTTLSESLRKRVTHAAAFSFKIACS